jgi:drug/metabolite transporter (DMT)-like permease
VRVRVALLTAAALVGFSANSLLTRSALAGGRIDPASFTNLRLMSGALTLYLIASARGRANPGGGWVSAAALAGYAIAFTLAYVRIGAGIGALILFGGVQVTMIGRGLVIGERPSLVDWFGLVIATGGLIVLTRPGLTAPDPLGSVLMIVAGVCWGAYSLAGRLSRDPLATTTGNFLRACVFGLIFAAVSLPSRHITGTGALLALASGSLASGVGYTLWYAALPALAAWRAAVLQLVVPVATAGAAALFLGEIVTPRLIIAMVCVLAGVGLTIRPAAATR